MSIHIHDHEGKHIGDICTGVNNRYFVYTRYPHAQKWDLKSKHRTSAAATKAMADAFAKNRSIKRAMVCLVSDYYDPSPICELVRR